MEQTKPLSRAPVTQALQKPSARATQPVAAQEQPTRKPPLDVPKQPMQTQPVEKQVQPVPEKKSRWWLWLIIALAVIGAGVGAYFLWIRPV